MAHTSNTTETINSGAINHVGFPGAEDGVSLVEMTTEVTAVAVISSVSLRLTARAATTASGLALPAGDYLQVRIGASTGAGADASAASQIKIQVLPQPQASVAVTVARPILRIRGGATVGATAAVPTVGARTLVRRSAQVSGVASVSGSSFKRAFRGASSGARAVVPATLALRRAHVSATTNSQATHSISATRRFRLSASAIGTSQGSVAEIVMRSVGASGSAFAQWSVSAGLYLFTAPNPISASSSSPSLNAGLRSRVGASGLASAASSSALAALRYRTGASTTAWVSSSIAAADYSVTIPAPDERRMVLPAMNRRMEVTE